MSALKRCGTDPDSMVEGTDDSTRSKKFKHDAGGNWSSGDILWLPDLEELGGVIELPGKELSV